MAGSGSHAFYSYKFASTSYNFFMDKFYGNGYIGNAHNHIIIQKREMENKKSLT
jgi:hypothetical protein